MFIGIGNPIPEIANLPGVSRPGRPGGGLESIANNFSMQFNGVDEFFDAGLITEVDGSADCTISFWMKRGISTSGLEERIISTRGTSIRDHGIEFRIRPSDGKLSYTFGFNQSGTGGGYTGGNISTSLNNDWHHVVLVVDATAGTTTSYLDGQPVQTLNKTTFSMSGTLYNFVIGARANDKTSNYFGYIDEVGVFDYKLTDANIENIYNITNDDPTQAADLSTLSTPPIAWYRMGD